MTPNEELYNKLKTYVTFNKNSKSNDIHLSYEEVVLIVETYDEFDNINYQEKLRMNDIQLKLGFQEFEDEFWTMRDLLEEKQISERTKLEDDACKLIEKLSKWIVENKIHI